jgi:hypothetical protein
MSNTTLKLPAGSFSHTDLAVANGKTNQQIWVEYSRLRKEGIIISAGTRSNGKGKPTSLWKVADGVPVPLVDKVEVVKVEAPKPEPTLVVVTETATVVEPLPSVVPTTAPVEAETVEVVEVIAPPVVRNLTCQVVEIEEKCPFCQTKLLSVETSGGIKVWCPVNDLKVCSCSENPYGVSNNVKNAVEILHDKFFKHRSPVKA